MSLNKSLCLGLLLKPRANGRNIVGQQLPTYVPCCVRLHTLLDVVVRYCVLLGLAAQSLKPVKS